LFDEKYVKINLAANQANKQMLLPPSPSRSEQVEEKKTSLYFLSHLMLSFIPLSSL
jgi:hypothetical protein